MAEPALSVYYDRLSTWTRVARLVGYGGGSEHFTVHRFLADPKAGGRPTPTRLHDIIADALPARTGISLLDAGCGLGGTMLDLVSRFDGRATGLTLSPAQRDRAIAVARARGLAPRIDVRVQSYDEPPPGPFDVVVAIESLAHSPDPARSVAALARVLAPGGCLVVVDDMPREGADAGDLETFKRGWRTPVLWSRSQFLAAFDACGVHVLRDDDLSPACQIRTLPQISRLMRLNRLARTFTWSASWRVVLDSYYGGLALERLYRQGGMAYRLLVAQKSDSPAQQV